MELKSLMKILQKLAKPRNLCISLTVIGLGQFKTACTLWSSIATPSGLTTYPMDISLLYHIAGGRLVAVKQLGHG